MGEPEGKKSVGGERCVFVIACDPTSEKENEIRSTFFEDLKDCLERMFNPNEKMAVMGELNAKVGEVTV